jgi:hypothetical protein
MLRAWLLWCLLPTAPRLLGAQQVTNQLFEVIPRAAHATVGDTISLAFRVRLDPLDLLYDTVPEPPSDLPEGVRLLSIEKLHRAQNREWIGRAQIAFFRLGHQPVPTFGLPFMRGVKGVTRATLTSDSAFVEIDPVAPPGNPSLKDLRDPPAGTSGLAKYLPVVLGLMGLAIAFAIRPRGSSSPVPALVAAATEVGPSAYDRARRRLGEIEGKNWLQHEDVSPYYAAVADTMRAYLAEAHGVGAMTRTTRELAETLQSDDTPPVARRTIELLAEMDMVKFARVRPAPSEGDRVLREAERQLSEWQALEGSELP